MRSECGPFARCRCGSAFGSWPPRAGTGWSGRLTQGLASSGLPGSLSTLTTFLEHGTQSVSAPVAQSQYQQSLLARTGVMINSSIDVFNSLPRYSHGIDMIAVQDAVSDPLRLRRADINNPHWLGQGVVINSSSEAFNNLPC